VSASIPEPSVPTEASTPLDVDGVTAVSIGCIAFALGFIGCVIFRDQLAANGQQWWMWVCIVGFVLGLGGLAFVVRRRSAYRAHRNAN